MKWIVAIIALLIPGALHAQENQVPDHALKECRIKAANTAMELNPAYRIRSIEAPVFKKSFKDEDEIGKRIFGRMYEGRMAFSVGDIEGFQSYSCVFISRDRKTWSFNWSGMGLVE